MGKAESFDFSDMAKYNSDAELTPGNGKKGCFISVLVGLLLFFLVVCLVIGVGLLVYFAGKDKNCSDTSAGSESSSVAELIDKCKDLIDNGESSVCKYLFFISIPHPLSLSLILILSLSLSLSLK